MPLSRSEQARVNGAKSHGPKTPQGKARSSQNAIKHGRYATNAIVLKNEDLEAFEELVANYVEIIQPSNTVEHHLTHELAATSWLITRVYALDTRLLDHEMDVQAPALDSAGLTPDDLTRLTVTGRSIVDRSNYPNYLARRATQLIRARQSTLAFLKDLRKNFQMAEPSSEIVPPEPLTAELPLPIKPDSNPLCGRADPQVCAEPPGSASKTLSSGSARRGGAALQRRVGRPGPASKLLPSPSECAPDSARPSNSVGGVPPIGGVALQRRLAPPTPATKPIPRSGADSPKTASGPPILTTLTGSSSAASNQAPSEAPTPNLPKAA